mmetsp:Transcript_16717/g.25112  ORF Transcript_16717/g.25112 Transcript_16717/m.25112 type:complete len:93 (+) Transcript_16717:30-308(+)
MKRSSVYFISLLSLIVLWVGLLWVRKDVSDIHKLWIDAAPFYALILFGCYCLMKLGLGVLMFNDCPGEIKKLEEEIIEAKADLKRRGYDCDE